MAVNLSLETKPDGSPAAKDASAVSVSAMDKINAFLLRFSRIPLKEKLFFVQHLGLMLRSGISLSAALKTLSLQTKNKRFVAVLNDVAARVERGSSFAESLSVHKDVFGELFVSMVEDGFMKAKNGITTIEEIMRVTKE